ncbi:transporter substrate-binding domain-containing protein [Gordonia desulfuricans]|uniref:transporter substrate-binding domain-containing protein n=1 Tax=Gordonia desulfuricans TaxID=89051 RepID=UPI001FD08BA1|nr:transporter substrate-binding domain-containing protein [Gordonia desulfuricans]
MTRTARLSAAGLAVLLAVAVAGCSSGGDDTSAGSSVTSGTVTSASGTSTSASGGESTTATRDDALAARVPEPIRSRGALIVGTAVPFAPGEFEKNGTVVGFDVDVIGEAATILGLRTDIRTTGFPSILPGVHDGTFDVGARLIFDTRPREEQVDMVTYFSGGTQWMQRAGSDVDPENSCGLRVAAETGTVQADTELPAKSSACETIGDQPIDVVGFDTLDQAVTALRDGAVDAISADSPVVAYAVARSSGALSVAGTPFDTEPYAFLVAKGSALAQPLRDAVQELLDSGRLSAIAHRWGLQDGLIATSTINGATES